MILVDMPGRTLDCLASITYKHLKAVSVFLELLEMENTVDHVLVVADGVVREISRMVVRGEEGNELVEEAFIEIFLLPRELFEPVAHVNVGAVSAENASPFRLEMFRDPCAVFHAFSDVMHVPDGGVLRCPVPSLDHPMTAVIFQVSSHHFSLLPFLPKGEGLSTVEAVDELHSPSLVLSFSPALRFEVATVRTSDFLAWRRRGKR